jgi:hypothetical protein
MLRASVDDMKEMPLRPRQAGNDKVLFYTTITFTSLGSFTMLLVDGPAFLVEF